MRKFFTIALALVLCAAAFAQETNRDENGKIKYGPYQTNKFWDNWFIGAGIGGNGHVDRIRDLFDGERPDLARGGTPAFQVFAGKWIDPCYGVRGVVQGWKGGHFNDNKDFKYWTVNGDFLVNASNLFWGYKEKRVYNLVPYASVMAIFSEGHAFGVGAGLLNTFRISNSFNIFLDLRTGVARQTITGAGVGGKILVNTASVGVMYNFKKNNWTRCSAACGKGDAAASAAAAQPKATQEELEELQKARENALNAATAANNAAAAANNAAAAANAATAAALQQQQQKPQPAQEPAPAKAAPAEEPAPAPAQAAPAQKTVPAQEVQQAIQELKDVQFATGKPSLDERAEKNLDTVADYLKSNPDVRIEVAGHTDNTGTDAINNPLSQKRAEVVAGYLKDRGVKDSQIEIKGYGSKKPIADNSTAEGRQQNRRVELNIL